MSEIKERKFLSDKPEVDPEKDLLGYAPFAKLLADSIRKMSPPEGLVIAIYGPWGSGKSSVLEFIIHYLETYDNEAEKPIVVRFNPWWFSGQEDLIKHFFGQLQATLGKRLKTSVEKITTLVSVFADVVSEVDIPGAGVPKKLTEYFPELNQDDVVQIKDRLARELERLDKRILIVIDDVDRLTSEDIRQLFQMIKAVADFPNIVYLLAFDKNVVADALDGTQGKGEDYLEKIVQVPFELPVPHKAALRQWLEQSLSEVFGTDIKRDKRWNNVYRDGVSQFIKTSRDIVRLTNTLNVTYVGVKGEVNLVDFIIIESLRLFCPTVYYVIRDYREKFVGAYDSFFLTELYDNDLEGFHASWRQSLPQEQQKVILDLVADVFPNLAKTWNSVTGNMIYSQPSSYSASVWRKEKRICVSFNFDLYFLRLSELKKRIPATKMKALLALANENTDRFRAELEEATRVLFPDGSSHFSAIVYQMHDYVGDEISVEHASAIIEVFFDDGDNLLLQESRNAVVWGFGSLVEIFRRIAQFLQLFDEPTRYEILRQAILKGHALSVIGDLIVVFGQQHGKYDADEPDSIPDRYLNLEHLEELEAIYLKKIKDSSSADSLLNVAQPILVLTIWRHLADDEEVRQWLNRVLENDKTLLSFLEHFLSYRVSRDGREPRFDLKSFSEYVEPENVYERVEKLKSQIYLSDTQVLVLESFLTTYENSQTNDGTMS